MCVGTTSPLLLYLWKKNFQTSSVISPKKLSRQKKYWSYDWSELDTMYWYVSMAAKLILRLTLVGHCFPMYRVFQRQQNDHKTNLGRILSWCSNGNKTDPKTDLRRILSLLMYATTDPKNDLSRILSFLMFFTGSKTDPKTDLSRIISWLIWQMGTKWSLDWHE